MFASKWFRKLVGSFALPQLSKINLPEICRHSNDMLMILHKIFFFFFKVSFSKFRRFSIYYLVIYFIICAMNRTLIIRLLDCLKPLEYWLYLLNSGNQRSVIPVVNIVLICWEKREENLCTNDLTPRGTVVWFPNRLGSSTLDCQIPFGIQCSILIGPQGESPEGERGWGCDVLFRCSVPLMHLCVYDLVYCHSLL